jgi:hypothetical protein
MTFMIVVYEVQNMNMLCMCEGLWSRPSHIHSIFMWCVCISCINILILDARVHCEVQHT